MISCTLLLSLLEQLKIELLYIVITKKHKALQVVPACIHINNNNNNNNNKNNSNITSYSNSNSNNDNNKVHDIMHSLYNTTKHSTITLLCLFTLLCLSYEVSMDENYFQISVVCIFIQVSYDLLL